MGDTMVYTSCENKRIKDIKKLNQKKYRMESKEFLIEGENLVREAYQNKKLKTLILEENTRLDIDVDTIYVNSKVLKYITSLDTPNKVLGICSELDERVIEGNVILIDGLQDPGNLGTIIRSSVAFNIDTVVLGNNTVDLYNPKVLRATEGMIFNTNIIKRDTKDFILDMKSNGYKIYGTNVEDGKELKTLEKNNKFVIIIGNEGNGISSVSKELSDEFIYINMNSNCESLNAGVAASIILYELGDL